MPLAVEIQHIHRVQCAFAMLQQHSVGLRAVRACSLTRSPLFIPIDACLHAQPNSTRFLWLHDWSFTYAIDWDGEAAHLVMHPQHPVGPVRRKE